MRDGKLLSQCRVKPVLDVPSVLIQYGQKRSGTTLQFQTLCAILFLLHEDTPEQVASTGQICPRPTMFSQFIPGQISQNHFADEATSTCPNNQYHSALMQRVVLFL